jgi:hypothetical protein
MSIFTKFQQISAIYAIVNIFSKHSLMNVDYMVALGCNVINIAWIWFAEY